MKIHKIIVEVFLMPLLTLNGIGKRYLQGDLEFWALKNIDLEVMEGEFTALVGPSGSGKTTLLNMIGVLDTPTQGSIRLNGQTITELKESQMADFRLNQLGFVFQSYNLVPVLTAFENVELVMLLQGRDEKEITAKVRHYLELVGLENEMHKRPSAMSGGQQQRVAVARALAAGPRLVLADEPTANLDSENATALLDIMYRLCQEEKTTFLFSTHDVRVMQRAKRIITLRDGQIVNDEQR